MWLAVLLAAREWGTPPWEIAGGDKLTWFSRWAEYSRIAGQKSADDMRAMQRRARK